MGAGPSFVRRLVRRTNAEVRALPPVRTRPPAFQGRGLGRWGKWQPGDPMGEQDQASEEAAARLLDWAEVSWSRWHAIEIVWDFSDPNVDRDTLPTSEEVDLISIEGGLRFAGGS